MPRQLKETKIDTRTARAKLEPRAQPYWRGLTHGVQLGYRKGKTGGAWLVRWSIGGGQDRRETFAEADDAREADGVQVLTYGQAVQRAGEIHQAATEPAAQARAASKARARKVSKSEMTVREACARYIEHLMAENGLKVTKNTAGRLRLHVDPEIPVPDKLQLGPSRKEAFAHATLGPRIINSLTLQDLTGWRNALVVHDDDPEVVRRSKDTANRTITMLKAALNRAIADDSNEIVTDKAWRLLKAFQGVGRPREIHLDADQVQRLINVTSGDFRHLVIGMLLTGVRPGTEPRFMRVRDFSSATGTVHVPVSKTGPRDVVLTTEGVEFFREITAGRHPDEWMFPRANGAQWGETDHNYRMSIAVAAAQLPEKTVAYSLRHTYASQSIMAGMQAQLLAENMGTSVRMLELNYAKFFATARRQMIEAAAPKLGLVKGNVVPLRSA